MSQIFVGTNGCVDGQLNSKQIEQFFKANNETVINDPTKADIIVFWACGLTNPRQKDSLRLIKKYKDDMKGDARMIVWGCLPKINPQAVRELYDGPLIGPLEKNFFEEIPEKVVVPLGEIDHASPTNELVSRDKSDIPSRKNIDYLTKSILLVKQGREKVKSYMQKDSKSYHISVATGCTGKCTYCSEKPVFGKVRSRPIEDIKSEFNKGLNLGYNRFSLIATDLGSYGLDRKSTLAHLLKELIEGNNNRNFKFILNQVSFHQFKRNFSDMEEVFATGKIEKFDCPVQSGSNRILKLMGRRYTAEVWRENMIEINKKFPKVRLSTQFMVGFPSETEEDFQETLNLLNRPLYLNSMWVFKFSPRPTVCASNNSEQVSTEAKSLRFRRLWQKYALMYASNPKQFKIA
jgi:MiaB/RimO family radical SAM methylthiotransferase